MRIGLVSDTHGYLEGVRRAAERFVDEGVETVLHAGDITRAEHIRPLARSVRILHLVRGNCDHGFDPNGLFPHQSGVVLHGSEAVLELDGHRVGLTHGHLDSSLRSLREENVELLIRGHTHRRQDEMIHGIRHVNPGAVKPPDSSFAIMDLADLDLRFIENSRA